IPHVYDIVFFLVQHFLVSSLFPYTTLFRSNFLLYSSARPSTRCSSLDVPRVVVTRACVSPRWKIAEPWVRGNTLTSQWISKSARSEEHTSELQSRSDLVCRLLLDKKQYKKS